ncbi:hypothetical protein [Burkholderia multivorans]|uniref:hypothetical protein n=1 Tax=Burkholderia multivorans TaxID=87883 RepID=UPI000CFE8773|nr:hypothetical protein [Burkholderia multivorans]MDN7479081.1 hypothetical protein [Burkholderia multivorans]PRE00357.1 hypothetical protein C6P91_26615 [Burkholderia multivorans]
MDRLFAEVARFARELQTLGTACVPRVLAAGFSQRSGENPMQAAALTAQRVEDGGGLRSRSR